MKGVLEKGLTLVELMIALFLGSILLLGLTQLVISSSSLGAANRNLANNQIYANSILDTIGVEARLAGYRGCSSGGKFTLAGGVTPTDQTKLFPVVPILNDPDGGIGMHLRFAMDVNSINAASEPFGIAEAKLNTLDCLNRDLYWREVKIRNCVRDATNSICISKFTNPTTDKATETVIPNATIQEMVFSLEFMGVAGVVSYEDRVIGKTSTDPTYSAAEFKTVTETLKEFLSTAAITITIEVITPEVGGSLDADATIKGRFYSATYNLRNLR